MLTLVNLGCGSSFHTDWKNYDFMPRENVQAVDLRKALPFQNSEIDVIYCSHALEHLSIMAAREFISECHRSLKPGGILRIVVPDLETIAETYLKTLKAAKSEPSEVNLIRHQWMTIEMVDQLCRDFPGGEMLRFWQQADEKIIPFLEERLGSEFIVFFKDWKLKQQTEGNQARPSPPLTRSSPLKWTREKIFKKIRKAFGEVELTDLQKYHLEIGHFRDGGQTHKWMYDQVSLRALCSDFSFRNFEIHQFDTSNIPNFNHYKLDMGPDGTSRKPDSIYIECQK